ncbi:hypothetical protein WJX82_007471 [Trebouxia sp. C0006]
MSTVQSTEMQLTLQPSACSGVEFADLGQKYHYDAQVAVANSSEVNCISISKLYVQDACISDRNNELGLKTVKQVTCQQTTDTTEKTCESVFSNAPAGAILNGTAATNGNYDDGDVCAAEANAFIYVKNICTDTTQGALSVTVTVTPSDYQGSICLDIAGHHINGSAAQMLAAVMMKYVSNWIIEL